MFKIDSANATPDNEFQDKDISVGQAGTRVTAEWLNAVQRELVAVIEAAGLAPSKLDDAQLLASILVLIDENAGGGGGGGGSPYWINAASNFTTLPSGRPVGSIGLTLDNNVLYRFNGTAWVQYYSPAELAAKIAATEKGAPNGVATLNALGQVPASQLPSWNPWLTGVNYTGAAAVNYGTLCIADTSAGAYSLNMPASPAAFAQVGFVRQGANNLTVYPPSGTRFHGLALNAGWVFTVDNSSALFVWSGTEYVPVFLGTGAGGGGGGPTSTDGLPEGGVNLYFTNARVLTVLTGQKNVPNGIPGLNASGKLEDSVLPDLSITDTFVVGNQAAMLALAAQKGDVAVRTDLNKTFILRVAGAATLSNWQELPTPTGAVLSVAGKTGAVVLDKSDVGLSNVDNTADLDKPISTATSTALTGKLNKSGGVADNLGVDDRITFTDLASDPLTPSSNHTSIYTKGGVLYKKLPDGSVSTIGSLRVMSLPDPTATYTAQSGFIYKVGNSAGTSIITLPGTTLEAFVQFVDRNELINDIRTVTLRPHTGDNVAGCAVDEDFILDYPGVNVGLYKAAGETEWSKVLPMVSISREATSTIEGTVSGNRYPGATVLPAVGLKGEYKKQAGASTVSAAADTWIDVVNASITLTSGVWKVGYIGALGITQVTASTASAANAALFIDSSLLVDTMSIAWNSGSDSRTNITACAQWVSVSDTIIVTGTQVLKLRIRCSTANTAAYARWWDNAGFSGALTDPDISQFIWAERV